MSFLRRLARDRPEAAEASVARNLTNVLNAKKGYAEAAEVFGLGDHDEPLATKPLLAALSREIVDRVKAFEPRARRPEVAFVGREGSLFAAFRLRCEIDGRPAAFWIRMHTILRYVEIEPIPAGPPDEGAAR